MGIARWAWWCAACLVGGVWLGGAGCAVIEPREGGDPEAALYHRALSWRYDPACAAPRPDDARRLEEAVALWNSYWPVSIGREPVAGVPSVAICLMDEWPDSEHSGLSYGPDPVTLEARIEAWRGVDARRYMTGLLAHELGHVILNSPGLYLDDHLADEVEGIMNPTVDCRGADDDCLWSAGDIEHLEEFGLIFASGRRRDRAPASGPG
jgi:hypothetical protein